MDKVKQYILSQVANQQISKEKAKELLMEINDINQVVHKDIAIIGIAGRYSKADNLEQFWELLKSGESTIRKYPAARMEDLRNVFKNPFVTEFLLGNTIAPELIDKSVAHCGYMNEIDKFDAEFFGIVPKEATYMDPNQRIALEVAWEAIENAGYGGDRLRGTKTGVYIGRDDTNYSYYKLCSKRDSLQLTGSWEGMVASRITYFLDLKGPSMIIDTACSAGMVSVHTAAKDLMLGECDVAIAGGINICSTGEIKAEYKNGATLSNVESGDNTIRTFDARATGTVWGEGAGIVILKPLQQALKDGDYIQAVIKASAINNDGMTNSLTAPSAKTQEQVILDAWKKAGIDPETISYLEAHGTGTVLGDPIEISGITNAFRKYTKKKQFCGIGSLKTTMGHMVGASGLASIAKVVKSFEHKMLPPNANFMEPNPYINFMDSPLYVNSELTDWDPECGIRRADINSFGFIRTNCHLVLEEPPAYKEKETLCEKYCLTVSARTEDGIIAYIAKYDEYLQHAQYSLNDICFTSNTGRGHYSYRAAITASSREELKELVGRINGMPPEDWSRYGIHFEHFVVTRKKEMLESYERTDAEISQLTNEAMFKLKRYVADNQRNNILLHDICSLYVRGADVDWNLLYKEEPVSKVPVPTYPLQKTRYWADVMESKIKPGELDAIHPLLEREAARINGSILFETVMSAEKQWVLSDHKINHISVLPGTSYLEMVKTALARVMNTNVLELKNIFFLQPMVLEDGEERKVYTLLKEEKGGYKFQVYSDMKSGRLTYVEGTASVGVSLQIPAMDIVAFKEHAEETVEEMPQITDTGVFQFGEHWKVVKSYWKNDNTYLLKMELPQNLQNELGVYTLHPGILDNAVNFTSQSTGETFLPFSYKKLLVNHSFEKVMYSKIVKKQQNDETAVYDVEILDENGAVITKIEDYITKKVHAESFRQFQNGNVCAKFVWNKWENKQNKNFDMNEKWGVILSKGRRGELLLEAMRKDGRQSVPIYLEMNQEESGNVFSPTVENIYKIANLLETEGCTGFLFATDYAVDGVETETSEEAKKELISQYCGWNEKGVNALFRFTKVFIEKNIKFPSGVVVLTLDAWKVDKNDNTFRPHSASTAGLARVIGQEYQHFHVEIVDVSHEVSPEQTIQECFHYTYKGYRALRKTGTYIERMEECECIPADSYEPEEDGVYILTGGLGGIALSIAQRLTEKKKINLLLVGRSQIADYSEWKALSKNMESENARKYSALLRIVKKAGSLEYFQTNVADPDGMKKLGTFVREKYTRIAAVYHTAGVPADGFLKSKEENVFFNVVKPKIDGTVLLLELLKKEDHAQLILFSSIVSLTGGEGQGDYCAGNSFLDAVVPYANGLGIQTVCVNWPGWLEVGISARLGLKDEYTLFRQITVKEGMEWLFYLQKHPQIRFVPAPINEDYLNRNKDELVFELSDSIKKMIEDKNVESSGRGKEAKEAKAVGITDMNEIQQNICDIYATVLGLDEIDVYKSFQELGGNSLMTTSLLKVVNQYYEGIVDIADLFSYASVIDLAKVIEERLNEKNGIEENKLENSEEETEGQITDDQRLKELLKEEIGDSDELLDVLNNVLSDEK